MLSDWELSDFETDEEEILKKLDDKNDDTCCDTKMFLDKLKSIYLCKSCGRSVKTVVDFSTWQTQLQTKNNDATVIKIAGKDSYKYQKGLYKTLKKDPNTAKKSRRRQIKKFIVMKNSQSKNFKLTPDIINDVLDLYENLVVSGNKSHRGRVKIGVLASLTFLSMNKKQIAKPIKQISIFYDIGLKLSGQGARLVSKQGVLYRTNIYQDYLGNICYHLGIMSFVPLLKDWLVHLNDIEKVYGESCCRTGTRLCSLIVVLKRLKPELEFLVKDVYSICFLSNISTKKFITQFIYNNRRELNKISRKRDPKFPKIKTRHLRPPQLKK